MVGIVAGGMMALAVAMGFGRFAYTPLLPWMQAAAGFDNATGGWIASLNYAGYLIGVVAAGFVDEARARRRLLGLSLLGTVVTLAAMALPGPVALWGAVRLLAGIASAGVFVFASTAVVTALAGHGRARLGGLHYGGVGLGIAASGVLVAMLAPRWGWQAGWLVLAGLGGLLALGAWKLLPETPPGYAAAHPVQPGRGPALALLGLSYFCEGAGYIVTGTFLVAILKATPGLTAWGESAWVVVGLAAFPSVFLWTAVAGRFGAVAALVAAHLVQAAGIVLPTLSSHPAAVLVSAASFGGTFIAITGLVLSIGSQLTGARAGRAIAWLTAAFGVGQVIGPPLAGLVADAEGGFTLPLRLAALVVVAGAGLAAAVPLVQRRAR